MHPRNSPSSSSTKDSGADHESKPGRHEWNSIVRETVGRLQYGEVQISIQKGRVVEVRTIEKTRFDP